MPEPLAIKSELMKRRTLKTKKICPKNCLNKRNFQKKKDNAGQRFCWAAENNFYSFWHIKSSTSERCLNWLKMWTTSGSTRVIPADNEMFNRLKPTYVLLEHKICRSRDNPASCRQLLSNTLHSPWEHRNRHPYRRDSPPGWLQLL